MPIFPPQPLSTVKIKDSHGKDISSTSENLYVKLNDIASSLLVDGKIKVAVFDSIGDSIGTLGETLGINIVRVGSITTSQLNGKLDIRGLLEHGTFKEFDGQISISTTLYTVPANKRVIIYSASLRLLDVPAIWELSKGSGLQDKLVSFDSVTIKNNNVLYIFNAGDLIRLNEQSGDETAIYNIHGIEVDIP